MSSYLAEVLSSSEKMEIEEINVKCPEVSTRLDICKSEVLKYLENVYVQFTERPKENKMLASKVKQLEDDITSLVSNCEQLTKKDLEMAKNEMKKNKLNLQKVKQEISFISTLYKVHEGLMKVSELKSEKLYFNCVQKMMEIDQFITSLDESRKLEVIEDLRYNLNGEKDELLLLLGESLTGQIIFEVKQNTSIIKISTDIEVMKEDLTTLYFSVNALPYLDRIGSGLLNTILLPLTQQKCVIEVREEQTFGICEVKFETSIDFSYEKVFSNLKVIIGFLVKYLNIELDETLTTLEYIGKEIYHELSNSIIGNCLQKNIPDNKEELKEFGKVIEAVEELEGTLKESKLFPEDFCDISNFVKNVDMLFIEKKCKKYIIEARNIMKKDLHDLVEVGKAPSDALELKEEFPLCSISRNVIELLNYLEKTLSETATLSEKSIPFLLNTVKNICLNYTSFVPEHHKKLLQTIPQQIALFYNNCNYISHTLTTWDETFLKNLQISLQFEDTGFQIKNSAAEKFSSFVDLQIQQIQSTVKGAWPSELVLKEIPKTVETAIRQCLRQQELLKTVWQKVLPYAIYNKTLGALLDNFCSQLVNSLLRYEDIHSTAAEELVDLLKMVESRAPKLFSEPREIALFASNWYKLNELVFVLGASLVDIDDRWAAGKGPLAMQFGAEEVRRLVKALFQDTERRAALLARVID